MQVQASAFKAYDIRGVVGAGFDETFAGPLAARRLPLVSGRWWWAATAGCRAPSWWQR